jgi:hypothetical protein
MQFKKSYSFFDYFFIFQIYPLFINQQIGLIVFKTITYNLIALFFLKKIEQLNCKRSLKTNETNKSVFIFHSLKVIKVYELPKKRVL